ncbi:MAG: hypothetical protein WCF65_09405, partial [Parachlamydiaceae bacterium]
CQSCYFIFLTENPLRSGDLGHPKVLPSFEPCRKAALSCISGGRRSINFPEKGFSGTLLSSLQKSRYSSTESLKACSS